MPAELPQNFDAPTTHLPASPEEWLEARKFFQRHGFIFFKDFFTPEQARRNREWAEEIGRRSEDFLSKAATSNITLEDLLKTNVSVPIVVPEKSNPKQVCRAEDFVTEFFGDFQQIPTQFSDIMKELDGEEYTLFKEKINFKWPGGGAFTAHQDYPAYDFLRPSEHITAMVSIDAATTENGCLQISGDWTEELRGVPEIDAKKLAAGRVVLPYVKGGKLHGTIDPKVVERLQWKHLNTTPRDLVLFSSFVPHYSEINASDKPRRAFFFTFNKASEGTHRSAYYDMKRNDPKNPIFHVGTPTLHNAVDQMM